MDQGQARAPRENQRRRRRVMTRPRVPDHALDQVVWAVWLGCTTPQALAREWRTPIDYALQRMRTANRAGRIERLEIHKHAMSRYRVTAPPREAIL